MRTTHTPLDTSPKKMSPPRPKLAAPSLFQYDQYRTYLRDWFTYKKCENPAYSGALFAQRAGLSAHTLLGMIIRGERNLSADSTRAFIKALGLNGKTALYFEKLVLLNQAKKADDKTYYLKQLLSIAEGTGKIKLNQLQNHIDYLSHWYVPVIRELVKTKNFTPSFEAIAARLKNKITKKEAEKAWFLLQDLKLVELDSNHTWQTAQGALDLGDGKADFAIKNYHKEWLDRSSQSVSESSIEERELSSLVFSIPSSQIPELKERIREFRKTLNTEQAADRSQRDQVVAVNMQLLILTD